MNDKQAVIQHIISTLTSRFDPLDNTTGERKIVAGQFPDILVFKKGSTADRDLLFIMRVENGGDLVDSLPQWKELATAPSTFYIVAPKNKLDDAKKLAGATGVKAKFASYRIAEGKVAELTYE